mmetsp:Transcript_13591/g.25523  ORF Transcript_13591/g.25523 Transcript_13591/m.25523 type:complete len:89 (+) Transcript_13591:998-1264(+)
MQSIQQLASIFIHKRLQGSKGYPRWMRCMVGFRTEIDFIPNSDGFSVHNYHALYYSHYSSGFDDSISLQMGEPDTNAISTIHGEDRRW